MDGFTPCPGACPPAEGGCTRAVLEERFKTPLVGGAAAFGGLGGNPPAPAFPQRGNGKGAIQIPCARKLITGHASRRNLSSGIPPASPYRHSKAGIPLNEVFRNSDLLACTTNSDDLAALRVGNLTSSSACIVRQTPHNGRFESAMAWLAFCQLQRRSA